MGNGQSFTENEDNGVYETNPYRSSHLNQSEGNDKPLNEGGASYDVVSFAGEDCQSLTIETNNNEAEILANAHGGKDISSGSSENRSSSSPTTSFTRYSQTNSVVSFEDDDFSSSIDDTSFSKSNSLLYDTDEVTAMTDMAHDGDDELTKQKVCQSRHSKLSTKLGTKIDRHSMQETDDRDNETETEAETIVIIDADEEFSRCSSTKIEMHDKTKGIPTATSTGNLLLSSHAKSCAENQQTEECRMDKENSKDGDDTDIVTIFVRGIQGVPVERNPHHEPSAKNTHTSMTKCTAEERSLRIRNTDLSMLQPKRLDPSGVVLHGMNAEPNHNRRIGAHGIKPSNSEPDVEVNHKRQITVKADQVSDCNTGRDVPIAKGFNETKCTSSALSKIVAVEVKELEVQVMKAFSQSDVNETGSSRRILGEQTNPDFSNVAATVDLEDSEFVQENPPSSSKACSPLTADGLNTDAELNRSRRISVYTSNIQEGSSNIADISCYSEPNHNRSIGAHGIRASNSESDVELNHKRQIAVKADQVSDCNTSRDVPIAKEFKETFSQSDVNETGSSSRIPGEQTNPDFSNAAATVDLEDSEFVQENPQYSPKTFASEKEFDTRRSEITEMKTAVSRISSNVVAEPLVTLAIGASISPTDAIRDGVRTLNIVSLVPHQNRKKITSPKPEDQRDRIIFPKNHHPDKINFNASSIANEDDIDLLLVQEYDEVFNTLMGQCPELMMDHAAAMELIRVAKLQKILSTTIEIQSELQEYVQSLNEQKLEMTSHYHSKLLEASKKKAARELHLQEELRKMKDDLGNRKRRSIWDTINAYRQLCIHYNDTQHQLLLQVADSNDPLNILPTSLAGNKKLLLDSLLATSDSSYSDGNRLDDLRNENALLSQQALTLEEKLASLQQKAITHNDAHSWVSPFLSNLDTDQLKHLRQRFDEHMTKTDSR